MIYFMRICNTGVLLVSNGRIPCDLIGVCSDDSHEYARIIYTLEFHDLRYMCVCMYVFVVKYMWIFFAGKDGNDE